MLLCDDARPSDGDRRKVNVYGLLNAIATAGSEAVFPVHHSFAVYLALTEGRGSGEGRIVVVQAESDEPMYVGQSLPLRFSADPLKVLGVIVRITSCSFPHPGLYWVEFWYNDQVIAREPLEVK
jgi:hypothetical protein